MQRWCAREAEERGAADPMAYFEASAKVGSGVEEAFQHIADLAFARMAPEKPGEDAIKMVDLANHSNDGNSSTGEASASGGCC